ncbi:nitrogenase iron-molybdenum cofactor biosynthesis protein NifN [Endothiovibrio diazotrophicus]
MAEIIKRKKALAVNPLKASQPLGAALAFLGINRTMPMFHGSQGCTAFAKVFFVRHFREPIPLQTSAMEQVSSVMGADDNVIEGLDTICTKSKPAMVSVISTGLSETQGSDLNRIVKEFRAKHPEHADIPVVWVNAPDYSGCLDTGFAAALGAIVDQLVPESGTTPGARKRQVNVLAGPSLTPGDLEVVKEMVESFGLRPLVLPDLSDSLDGHLIDADFSPVTVGGTPVSDIPLLGDSAATLVIGQSLYGVADKLHKKTGVPDYRFPHLFGLEAVDAFVAALHEISGEPVPPRLERQRAQLQDTMVDTHFMLGQARVAVALDPELLCAFADLLQGMGAEVVAAVAPARGPGLEAIATEAVKIGDLEDLECAAKEARAQLIIGNSHAAQSADRLGLPLLRTGFPQWDRLGGYQRVWVGYRGTRQALFDLANLMLTDHSHSIAPYRSIYKMPETMGHERSTSPATH